jgi:uncharacterized protein YjiS (DUF1127 family)
MRKMIMSTSTVSTQGETIASSLAHLFSSAAKRSWVAYRGWSTEQLTVARLRSMSDRQLKNIGVARSEIEFAVRNRLERDHILSRCF